MTKHVSILVSDVIFDHYGDHSITAYLASHAQPDCIEGSPIGRGIDTEHALINLDTNIQADSGVAVTWVYDVH